MAEFTKENEMKDIFSPDRYEVIVGNIGTVYHGNNKKVAISIFREYQRQSDGDMGRASGENISLMEYGEVINEYVHN